MQSLTSLVIPVAVFVLMWIVGLDLTPADFRRIARYPTATLVGTAGQLACLPVVATLLILFLRPPPAIVGGVILIAGAPSGAISNLLTLLARGNAALSVTMTAVSNTLGVITYPLLAAGGFGLLLKETVEVRVPIPTMMGQLVVLMVLPICLGMLVRLRRESVYRYRAFFHRVSLLLVFGVVLAVVIDQRAILVESVRSVAALAATLTISVMFVGLGLARLAGLPLVDGTSFVMEFSARNAAIALVVAVTTLGRPDYAVFIVAYFLVQMLVTIPVIGLLRRLTVEEPPARTAS
jgi:bile acid:Na+ symporter, BASS family